MHGLWSLAFSWWAEVRGKEGLSYDENIQCGSLFNTFNPGPFKVYLVIASKVGGKTMHELISFNVGKKMKWDGQHQENFI